MKNGCIYNHKVPQGNDKTVGFCILRKQFQCEGSKDEKMICPEWGATMAAELYYKLKTEGEKQ